MDKVKELERKIQAYRDGAALYCTVSEVVRAWDGKCYNKRFSDALRAATGGRVLALLVLLVMHFLKVGHQKKRC